MRESSQALEAFVLYRDMGPARSLEALHQKYPDTTPTVRQLKTWSAAHNWQERIAQHEARIAAEAEERARRDRLAEMDKLRRVRLGIAQTEQAIALKWLQKMVNDDRAIGGMKATDIIAFVKSAQDTQRLEYDEPTDRTDHTSGGEPLRFTIRIDRSEGEDGDDDRDPAPGEACDTGAA